MSPSPSLHALNERPLAREALDLLRKGECPPVPMDLSRLQLRGADLRGLDLTAADLSESDLSGADLGGTNLFGAKLVGANLFEAKLRNAELTGADLSRVRAERADFAHAGLGRTQLREAHLRMADLSGATLSGSQAQGVDLRASRLRGLRALEANLEGADLSNADLREADLRQARIAGAEFRAADLRGSQLGGLVGYTKAGWIDVDIRNVDFTGAHLCRKYVLDENYIQEFRTQSGWNCVVYHIWNLTSDCGRSILRWSLWTAGLALLFAWVYSQVGIDYGEHATAISPLYFSVITLTTLGYGDAIPTTPMGQVACMAQVVLGYVMLGGLLSLFSNKMGTRSD